MSYIFQLHAAFFLHFRLALVYITLTEFFQSTGTVTVFRQDISKFNSETYKLESPPFKQLPFLTILDPDLLLGTGY